jgi:hypothetical protein
MLDGAGIPIFVDVICRHILTDGVVQYNGLFAEQVTQPTLLHTEMWMFVCEMFVYARACTFLDIVHVLRLSQTQMHKHMKSDWFLGVETAGTDLVLSAMSS